VIFFGERNKEKVYYSIVFAEHKFAHMDPHITLEDV
jgi:hypothetical protein